MPRRIAVIMAGGSGERFWPLSTASRPKQLLKLTSDTETMLEEAVNRVAPVVGHDNVYVATSNLLEGPVRSASVVAPQNVWAEPAKRNTLGCLSWAAAHLLSMGEPDTTVAVLTADHKIEEPEKFRQSVLAAMELAEEKDALVTIGIPPTRPETGYGYIEVDYTDVSLATSGIEGYRATSFREKPGSSAAQRYVEAGNFLWNSGMFFFRLSSFIKELELASADARALVDSMANDLARGAKATAEESFMKLPSISVDFAVMEKAQNMLVVPASFPWDDVGSWDSLDRTLGTDGEGNVRQGTALVRDTKGSIIVNDSDRVKVGVVGLENVIVVVTDGAVLVCAKEQAQRVREVSQ